MPIFKPGSYLHLRTKKSQGKSSSGTTGVSRAKHGTTRSAPTLISPDEARTHKLRSFKRMNAIFIPTGLYISYCASGIFALDMTTSEILHDFMPTLRYCLTHPIECYNDKTFPVMGIGALLYALFALNRYQKLNYNLIHGKEFGQAKWGDIAAFNAKYATPEIQTTSKIAKSTTIGNTTNTDIPITASPNRILSEHIRFRYSSDTLRNNNTIVVGGSGAGKTSFFLTPNLINNHGCNIIVDPKGSLYNELGAYLGKQKNTRTYVLDLCTMNKSMRINPFLFIRSRTDVTRLIKNYIQNTNNPQIKNSTADPFWERSEQMFLEAVFLYVWLECPKNDFDEKTGQILKLARDWRTVLYLIDEAQFISADEPPKLDTRMNNLAIKNPRHPAVKAYRRYRSGPEETVRSVIMTVNARMQAFDNDELMRIFSGNDIPLDSFGVGLDGDEVTKLNLFIIIPDDDETYNFIPGMVYTLLFRLLYANARLYKHSRLPMDVGFWLDEFANTKMPSNFDKILATCRSRGVYCVPMLQSLSQLKTLFENGAWEGVVGNCDTFLYLGGNEPSTYEYISKALGKWTVDKRTSGESHGSSGSSSENYDVLGRELMMEYEVRLLPDDECILFVRGELPLRDKKWFPWEHDEYKAAVSAAEEGDTDPFEKSIGASTSATKTSSPKGKADESSDGYAFISAKTLKFLKAKTPNVRVANIHPIDFMQTDFDSILRKMHQPSDATSKDQPAGIPVEQISRIIEDTKQKKQHASAERLRKKMSEMTILDIYAHDAIGRTRREVITRMLKNHATDADIRSVISLDRSDEEVVKMCELWEGMMGKG